MPATFIRDAQPRYQGRPLSYWTGLYMTGPPLEVFGSNPTADYALSQMGTNALPHLLAWFNYNPTPRIRSLEPLYRLLPRGVRHTPLVVNLFHKNANRDRAECAFLGLIALAPQAGPAIPDLVRFMNTSNSSFFPGRAAFLLELTANKAAIPELAAAVTNRTHPNRAAIISALDKFGTNAYLAIPLLTNLLRDPDPAIRATAQEKLQNISDAPRPTHPPSEPLRCLRSFAPNSIREIRVIRGPCSVRSINHQLSTLNHSQARLLHQRNLSLTLCALCAPPRQKN